MMALIFTVVYGMTAAAQDGSTDSPPPADRGPLLARIIAIGDTGHGGPPQAGCGGVDVCQAEVDSMREKAKTLVPDVVLALGDFHYGLAKDSKGSKRTVEAFEVSTLAWWSTWITDPALKGRILPVRGNHEVDDVKMRTGDS